MTIGLLAFILNVIFFYKCSLSMKKKQHVKTCPYALQDQSRAPRRYYCVIWGHGFQAIWGDSFLEGYERLFR